MAGHSHWASIKHQKAAADARKGKVFTKLARMIIVAARKGPDPDMNFALRHAIEKARAASMPKDSIEYAIKKGAGLLEGQSALVEMLFEGYAQGGIAILAEALTDNRNRTASEVRKIWETAGGKMGSSGSVLWMFSRKGLISVDVKAVPEDKLLELALEVGADDVTRSQDVYEVTCSVENFQKVKEALEKSRISLKTAELTYLPSSEVDCDAETARKVLTLMERIEEHDDIQNVYTNMRMSDAVLAEMKR
ncbi:MAG: YebC/PmpR family DNA-binding transcriptional regulator [Planctomycetota bacterium]|nr:YebC/PmpR family DNA-binding transcriptional regulator [Planctomycetota bacterium]